MMKDLWYRRVLPVLLTAALFMPESLSARVPNYFPQVVQRFDQLAGGASVEGELQLSDWIRRLNAGARGQHLSETESDILSAINGAYPGPLDDGGYIKDVPANRSYFNDFIRIQASKIVRQQSQDRRIIADDIDVESHSSNWAERMTQEVAVFAGHLADALPDVPDMDEFDAMVDDVLASISDYIDEQLVNYRSSQRTTAQIQDMVYWSSRGKSLDQISAMTGVSRSTVHRDLKGAHYFLRKQAQSPSELTVQTLLFKQAQEKIRNTTMVLRTLELAALSSSVPIACRASETPSAAMTGWTGKPSVDVSTSLYAATNPALPFVSHSFRLAP